VLYADEFERPDFNEMINKPLQLMRNYNVNKVFIDAANPAIITRLKQAIGERIDYEEQIAHLKSKHINPVRWMQALPVSFNAEHIEMLGHTKMLIEKELLAINPRFNKLITSLRNAVEQDGILHKQSTSFNDTFDAFRLSLRYYKESNT
jgi:hypothetical protein